MNDSRAAEALDTESGIVLALGTPRARASVEHKLDDFLTADEQLDDAEDTSGLNRAHTPEPASSTAVRDAERA